MPDLAPTEITRALEMRRNGQTYRVISRYLRRPVSTIHRSNQRFRKTGTYVNALRVAMIVSFGFVYGLIASRWYGYKVGVRPQNPPSSAKRNNSLNILIVGFDSTSRGGFMLKLPKSFRVLINEMDAVLLKGQVDKNWMSFSYNIVGDGTAEALFPILSGKTDIQHHPHARQMHSKDTLLDPDLFIFQTAREDGYHTAYYEDMPWIGSFQFRYNGFKKRPADHYLRSFFMEESQRGLKWLSGIRRRYCVGEKPTFLVLLDLTRQVLDLILVIHNIIAHLVEARLQGGEFECLHAPLTFLSYFMKVKGKRLCFTFMGDVSHDDFNRISTVDDDLVEFLRHIKQSGYLEDTMLIVMGDHGPRFGPWRESDQGKVDERLPFMSIVLPERLKRERPDALGILQANALVLTTPFDIHTTLLDAMDLSQHASDFVVPNAVLKRGLSLLKQ
ncbi:jg17612, partial [Pararge aegeria aegeria]